jgi:hypothetical protein
MPTEADTCRRFVVPKLQAAGWDNEPYSIAEQRTITDGRIVPVGKGFVRRPSKRVDYLLRYRRDFPLAVVEAKPEYKTAADGLQQAKRYAEMLDLKFAYASNGPDTIEFDYFTGLEKTIATYPSPEELWRRYRDGKQLKDDSAVEQLLTPINFTLKQGERYYQEIAINRAVEAIVTGKRRILLTMATGTGKTPVAFQICWKLWNARWNRTGEHRRPKILYLSDRNILIDDPKDKIFAQFGDARAKIEYGHAIKSREVYFAIYQALAEDERRPGLYKEYAPDFFDLIIIDECHRGSAREESNWREILEYFEPAYQLGMTATPLRDETRDTYLYFGNPLDSISNRQIQNSHAVGKLRKGILDDLQLIRRWPLQPIRIAATPVDRRVAPKPGREYRIAGVRLWGEGVYEREPVDGASTKYGFFTQLKPGDIVVNKIWARNGSVGVVPKELDGAFVSSEFPVFEPDRNQLEPDWFKWVVKMSFFWEQCDEKSRGTTGKNRIRPEKFLDVLIPLPKPDEQKRISAYLDIVDRDLDALKRLQAETAAELDALLPSILDRAFKGEL